MRFNMSSTITEKIFRAHCRNKNARSGDFVEAGVDFMLGNDITAPLAVKEIEKIGAKKLFDKNRIALIPDHFTPSKDLKSANQCRILKDFAARYKIMYETNIFYSFQIQSS